MIKIFNIWVLYISDPINTTITIRKGRNEGNVDDSYVNDDSKKAPAAAAAAPLLDNNELNHNDLSTGARGMSAFVAVWGISL